MRLMRMDMMMSVMGMMNIVMEINDMQSIFSHEVKIGSSKTLCQYFILKVC
jgi:hypothetical protein